MAHSIGIHDAILENIYKGVTGPTIVGPIRIRLHTADPGAAGTANEVDTASWTNYVPGEVNASGAVEPFFATPADAAGVRQTENTGAVSFGTATMDVPATTVAVTHFSIFDSTGTPIFIGANALDVPKTINDGDPVSFPTGSLRASFGPAA